MPDTHEDIRRRLFEAAWETPTYAPAAERTILRARRRAGVTISGMAVALMTVAAAMVVSFGSVPLANRETGIDVLDEDPREYIVDVTTGERTEFGNLPSSAWLYDISPDGSKMTFVADTSGRSQVWVMDMDGTDLRQLSDDPYEAIDPDWSHDSSSSSAAARSAASSLSTWRAAWSTVCIRTPAVSERAAMSGTPNGHRAAM